MKIETYLFKLTFLGTGSWEHRKHVSLLRVPLWDIVRNEDLEKYMDDSLFTFKK
jgi:hypothetical protein